MKMNDYPFLDDNNMSCMIFNARTVDEVNHILQIYKTSECINIHYYFEEYFDDGIRATGVNSKYQFNKLSDDYITNEEIEKLIIVLKSIIEYNPFLEIVSDELSAFGKKIEIRKGLMQEDFDLLSPKILINKSFENIYDLVSENKSEYFDLISDKFKVAANVGGGLMKKKVEI